MKPYQYTVILGYVGQDAQMKYTDKGTPVLSFSVAISERWTDKAGETKERTNWYNVTAWSKLAEIVSKFNISKGDIVLVTGVTEATAYTAKDGSARAELVLTAKDINIISQKQPADISVSVDSADDIPF